MSSTHNPRAIPFFDTKLPLIAAEMTSNIVPSQNRFLTCAEVEQRHILSVLNFYGGHRIKTAQALGITRATLYNKLTKYGVVAKFEVED